jgi:hypothetical protein
MIKRIIKRVYLVFAVLSFLNGVLIGFHLMFYPNIGLPDSEDWKYMLYYFGSGLVLQYIALHFFNDQEEREESN